MSDLGLDLLSLDRDRELLISHFTDLASVHKAIEDLVLGGRLWRIRRGVYRVHGTDPPSLVKILDAAHPDRDLRISGAMALYLRSLGPLPDQVHVFREKQARNFTLPKGASLQNPKKALRVIYIRQDPLDVSEMDVHDPLISTSQQAIIDILSHPSWQVPISSLRHALRSMAPWDESLEIAHANTRRRLSVLVFQEQSKKLNYAIGGSKATILLDAKGKKAGPLVKPWNVMDNA